MTMFAIVEILETIEAFKFIINGPFIVQILKLVY